MIIAKTRGIKKNKTKDRVFYAVFSKRTTYELISYRCDTFSCCSSNPRSRILHTPLFRSIPSTLLYRRNTSDQKRKCKVSPVCPKCSRPEARWTNRPICSGRPSIKQSPSKPKTKRLSPKTTPSPASPNRPILPSSDRVRRSSYLPPLFQNLPCTYCCFNVSKRPFSYWLRNIVSAPLIPGVISLDNLSMK